jgi:hypothetical protein
VRCTPWFFDVSPRRLSLGSCEATPSDMFVYLLPSRSEFHMPCLGDLLASVSPRYVVTRATVDVVSEGRARREGELSEAKPREQETREA